MKEMLRRSMATLVGSVALLLAPAAFAEGEPCYNDDDCPNPACGGDVCNWQKQSPTPDGDKVFYCQPAGRDPQGQDGWCTTDDNCKCKGEGATCVAPYCSKTLSSGGGTGAGGTGTAGSGTAGTGTAGTGTAGTGTAGTGTGAGGTGSKPPAEESSGCSTAAPITTGGGVALALGMLGVGAALSRRRRR